MSDLTWTNARRKLSDLIPWGDNPAQIGKAEAARLEQSLADFGQVQTIAIEPDGQICDGHQRRAVWAASQRYGADYEVDVRIASRKLTDEERRKLVVFLRSGTVGQYDWDKLSSWDTGDLQAWGLNAETLLAWDDAAANLREMLTAETEAPPDDAGAQNDRADELRELWGVETRQLWKLGDHSLFCGDYKDCGFSGYETVVFDPEWDSMPDAIHADSVLAFCDGASIGDVIGRYGSPAWVFSWDCVTSWYTPNRPLRRMKLCAWYGDVEKYNFDGWHYGEPGKEKDVKNTRGEYRFIPDVRGKHLSDLFQYQITKLHSDEYHNHSKPIDWVTLLIANCTSGVVFDPFAGSGTSIIACERLSRVCISSEIDPGFVAVILQRWLDTTGIKPSLSH